MSFNIQIQKIESLLEERIGLSPESVGPDTIAKAIYHRMSCCGLSDNEREGRMAYLAHLGTSEKEWESLIREVVVPETWFFRNKASFRYLGGHVRFEWLPAANPDRVLRVLSVPCSTGEEPCSIAMTFLNMGVPKEIEKGRFHIDAVDVSVAALQKAGLGIYGPESFRGEDVAFRDRHFKEMSGENAVSEGHESRPIPLSPVGGPTSLVGFEIHPTVRKMVHYMRGNLLDEDFLSHEMPYDIIFFRNLLIYLSDAAKERAMRVIDRLLARNGILFVGHVERPLVCNSAKKTRFAWIRQAGVFACRRADGGQGSKARGKGKGAGGKRQGARGKGKGARGKGKGERGGGQGAIEKDVEGRPPDPPMSIDQKHRSQALIGGHRRQASPLAHCPLPIVHRPDPPTSPDKKRCREHALTGGHQGPHPSPAKESLLCAARRFADQGALDSSLELCERQLAEDPFHIQAHFLIGLIWNAMGEEVRAEEYFNKTLYLDPNHHEAMSHLALIMENRGLADKAEHLRQRIQRTFRKIEA